MPKSRKPQIQTAELLRRALVEFNAEYFRLNPNGPTVTQTIVLSYLIQRGAMCQRRIVEGTAIDRSTLCEMLIAMQRDGYVETVRSKSDERKIMVTITPRGISTLRKAEESAYGAEKHLMEKLPRGSRTRFLAHLMRLTQGAING